MKIQLSDHFTYKRLFRFVLPSIGMMIFTSIYGVVDGFFVSNFVGGTAFAAVNLILPFVMMLSAVGFMIGTGGTALISLRLGEGDEKRANETFSLLVYLAIFLGILLTAIGEVFLVPIAIRLGATTDMLPYCVAYGRISLLTLAPFMLQNMFQSFLVAAEQPKFGLAITIAAGVTNMVLDGILVGVCSLGVQGAALATGASELVGGLIPLLLFIRPKKSRLRLIRAPFDFPSIQKTCSNGISEFLTNISMSVVNMLYNMQLLKYAGEKGVATYGVIMYVNFIFVSIFIGYSIGTAPIVGFNYGARNEKELQNIFKKSLLLICAAAVSMALLANLLATPLARMFVGYDPQLLEMTRHALHIYSLSFLLMGFNIYGSAFFTALSNGPVSALISFLRTCVFQVAMVLVLPIFFRLNGIWASVVVADLLSLFVTATFFIKKRKQYHYI